MSRWWHRTRALLTGDRAATGHFARPAEWTPTAQAVRELARSAVTDAPPGTDVVAGVTGRGQVLHTLPDVPVVVAGPPGSGKTSALAVTATLEWRGSVIVTSTSRDILTHTAGWRAGQGPVLIFGPTARLDPAAARFLRPWTPLVACLDRDGRPSWNATLRTARTLVWAVQDGDTRGTDAFWGRKAGELLAVALFTVACEDEAARADPTSAARPGRMQDVLEFVADCEDAKQHAGRQMAVAAAGEPRAELLARALLRLPPATLGGICTTAMDALSAYLFTGAADALVADCMRPDELLDHPATLYLIGSGPEQQLYRPIYTALLSWLFYEAEARADAEPGGRLRVPLLVVNDEAGTGAALPELPRVMATVRKSGIRLITFWHDLSQLDARYGTAQAGTILSSAGSVLVLPGLTDHRSTDWVERAFGLREVLDESTSESRSSTRGGDGERSESRQQSTNRSITRLPLVPAGAVPTMPPGMLLALIGPHRLTLHQRRWFDHPELAARAATPIRPVPSTRSTHVPRLQPRSTGPRPQPGG
jgi:type IV secretory pathway TraG/TraD family ATPase VirD4